MHTYTKVPGNALNLGSFLSLWK